MVMQSPDFTEVIMMNKRQFNAAISRLSKATTRQDVPAVARFAYNAFVSDGNIEPLNAALAAIQHACGVNAGRRVFALGNGDQPADKGLVPFTIKDGFAQGKINKARRDWLNAEAGDSGASRGEAMLEANIAAWLSSLDAHSDAAKKRAEWELAKWAKAQRKVLDKHDISLSEAMKALKTA